MSISSVLDRRSEEAASGVRASEPASSRRRIVESAVTDGMMERANEEAKTFPDSEIVQTADSILAYAGLSQHTRTARAEKPKAATQSVFARKEMKYILDAHQASYLLDVAENHLAPSSYAMSSVRSLYYDTADFDLMTRSIEAKAFKEKLRLRVYGDDVSHEAPSFIELKEKFKGIVYKRRIKLPLWIALDFLADPSAGPEIARESLTTWRDNQIAEEIGWFMSSHGPLSPSILTCCDRTSFEEDAGDLRMTFDSNLVGNVGATSIDDFDGSRPLLEEGAYVMEVKSSSAIPIWLAQALSEAKAYKRSFSKCGTAFKMERGVPLC